MWRLPQLASTWDRERWMNTICAREQAILGNTWPGSQEGHGERCDSASSDLPERPRMEHSESAMDSGISTLNATITSP